MSYFGLWLPVVGIKISGPRDSVIQVGQPFTQAGFGVVRQEKVNHYKIEILIVSKTPPKE
jgi:hypothetical protein